MSDRDRVTVRIDRGLREKIDREAVRTKRNASLVIREALRDYLRRDQR
jgi:predicted transcriptional regulator